MIRADKSKSFNQLFYRYNYHYLLKRHFHEVGMIGRPDPFEPGPVLYLMNHCSWWDGLLVYHAEQTASKRDHYLMMDERQMRSLRFFRKIGAFSVDKTSPREIVRSLDYAAELLRAGASVWLFPQGDIRHLETRPLGFQTGIGRLAQMVPEAVIVPVTVYYGLTQQKPQASLWFGAPVARSELERLDRHALSAELERQLTEQLDAHRALAIAGTLPPDHEWLLRPRKRTDETFTAAKRKVRRWLPFSG